MSDEHLCGECECWKPMICFYKNKKKNMSKSAKACKHFVMKVKK